MTANTDRTDNPTSHDGTAQTDPALLLEACCEHVRRGETDYRERMLAAGRLAREYILARVRQAGSAKARPAAVKTIAGRLAEVTAVSFDVSKLIKASAAVELLAGDTDYTGMAYSVIRDAFSLLAHRERKTETYVIHPNVNPDAARELFRHCAVQRVDGETAQALVRSLIDPDYQPKTRGRRNKDAGQGQGQEQGTPAAMAAELVTGSDGPDDTLRDLLAQLAGHGELSAKAKRACQAALVILTRRDSPSPAEVAAAHKPHPNGHLNHA